MVRSDKKLMKPREDYNFNGSQNITRIVENKKYRLSTLWADTHASIYNM